MSTLKFIILKSLEDSGTKLPKKQEPKSCPRPKQTGRPADTNHIESASVDKSGNDC